MTDIASVAFDILSSVGGRIAAAFASYIVADREPHAFNELAAHVLWTTTPVEVHPRQKSWIYACRALTDGKITLRHQGGSARPLCDLPGLKRELCGNKITAHELLDFSVAAAESYARMTAVSVDSGFAISEPFERGEATLEDYIGALCHQVPRPARAANSGGNSYLL